MGLHFRGIEVPPLGSSRDLIYRQYLMREAKVEAKKQLLPLLIAIGAPVISDPAEKSKWDRQAKKIFDDYVALLCGEEISESDKEEARLLEFYENHIKNSKPILKGNSKREGSLSVTGIPGVYLEEFNPDGSLRSSRK